MLCSLMYPIIFLLYSLIIGGITKYFAYGEIDFYKKSIELVIGFIVAISFFVFMVNLIFYLPYIIGINKNHKLLNKHLHKNGKLIKVKK